MFRGLFIVPANRLLLMAAILALALPALAQHDGGHGISIGGYVPERPHGVDETDDLKDYHHLVAVQATGQQVAEFQALLKTIDDAKTKLTALRSITNPAREAIASSDQALQTVHTDHQKFEAGLSEAQKSGLKKITKRLEHSDAELDRTSKRLDQVAERDSSPEVPAALADVDKSLADFATDQLALAKEMSIILADDTAFSLPQARKPVNIGSQSIPVEISGDLSQSAADGNLRTFQINLMADLSELERNVDAVMKGQIDSNRNCGERLLVRHATLTTAAPSTSLLLQLHYERWSCIGGSANELAESDGSVDLKLTPGLDQSHGAAVIADLKRINASGMMESALREGSLGEELRNRAARAMLTIVREASDFKAILPAALQNTAHLDRLSFENGGALRLKISGSVQFSNEQVQAFANQLNQRLSAQSAKTTTQQ